ncbi:MAG: SGNH/GDSL hydrolase family protein, partial [Parasporobacterium sp.]|nr:SGNH/GDSL hydrolase family protein [Parasporobacterium sp.]
NIGNNDVVFFGDCEAYEVFSPVALYESYGITSYVRGSSQQLIWQSYYLMEDTLRWEKPKVMVLSICDVMHADPDSTGNKTEREAYNRMTLDDMRWSATKVNAIQASMTKEEREKDAMWTYIFPILRYHERWNEINSDDFKYFFTKDKVTSNGYMINVGVRPVEGEYTDRPLVSYQFSDMVMEYLNKAADLCEANGVKLVIVKSPALYPIWHEEYEEQVVAFAEERGLDYYNLIELEAEIGLDWTTDTFDKGLHLNVDGGEKVTEYFGGILAAEYGLEDHRDDPAIAADWAVKSAEYALKKAEKQAEWEEIKDKENK